MRTIFAAIAAVALSAGASLASTVDFHFGSSHPSYTSKVSKTVDGITLDVTGLRCDGSSCWSSNKLVEWGTGIGIYSNSQDSHQVDGYYRDEYLKLTFSEEVTLDAAKFTYYSADDDFTLHTWNGSKFVFNGHGDACEANCGGSHTVHTYDFAGTYTSTMFLIGAKYDDDDWKFKGVSVTPVPLPAAGFMLLAGLGGLAAMKRRKKT